MNRADCKRFPSRASNIEIASDFIFDIDSEMKQRITLNATFGAESDAIHCGSDFPILVRILVFCRDRLFYPRNLR